ncbi:MAG: hypothetical protein R2776_04770 [Flavobacteriaceae bacterium]|nr:hypothetical protein [Flavobacteriaceae bacterium]
MTVWEKNLAIFNELVAMNPKFERLGKTMPYCAANTHMFALLNKDGKLGLRLSKESQEAFKLNYNTTIYKSYGAVMKDYVLVPDEMLNNLKLLSTYLNESYEYVMSLPASPRKKEL